RHDRIFELAEAGLVLVAPIKKDHFVAVGLDQFVDLLRCDMFATADHAVFIDLELVLTVAEADQLAAMPYAQAREIFALAVAPLELGVLEARILLGLLDVALQVVDLAADRAIDAVAADQNTAPQVEAFAERSLPKLDRLWIGDRREFVVEKNLLHSRIIALPPQRNALPEADGSKSRRWSGASLGRKPKWATLFLVIGPTSRFALPRRRSSRPGGAVVLALAVALRFAPFRVVFLVEISHFA